MKLSVSQLGWPSSITNREAAVMLMRNGIYHVDILPGKYASAAEALVDFIPVGVGIVGAQSLLFGCTDNIFGTDQERDAIAERLERVFKLCSEAGARNLTFGSPKNRDKRDYTDAVARSIATSYFQRIAKIAAKYGVVLCLEPNPTIYGCNFMTTTEEAASIVRAVDHPNVQLQIDLGCITANGENLLDICRRWHGIVGHIHISEPHLAPIQDHNGRHGRYAKILNQYFPERTATIEVIHKSDGQTIEESIATAKAYYHT